MKKSTLIAILIFLLSDLVFSNGVVFNTNKKESYLRLTESKVNVSIENQVATTVATQRFLNDIGDSLSIKYAFPIPEGASATGLRYKINGQWYVAVFSPVPQDTTTGGGSWDEDYNLKNYLGNNPLFFEIEQKIDLDSTITVELTYVELLKYKFGKVKYTYPNDYTQIQSDIIAKQQLNLQINSDRTIEEIELLSHSEAEITNNGNNATLIFQDFDNVADSDYYVEYSLSLNELGLFSLSTYLPDSIQKDSYGRGFFSFIVEPDPSENTDVINKVFTLIIDKSGSMSGDKIVQAANAAKFIVNNLNPGDKFNIISFDTNIKSFRSQHVDYNIENQNAALEYINSLYADGSTNISGAFDTAIPQFSVAEPGTANIIIFFTDGEQTAGITDTDELIEHIDNLITQSEKQINLFTFGIGSYTNERLLTTIASNNNGISEFLKDNELEEVITDFYLMIKNPVLLNTKIAFSPDIIRELYPVRLPNLYKGQQMILIGRYIEALDLETTLTGNAFSENVEYKYTTGLSDSNNVKLQFLTKIWAKSKIDYLMEQYYQNTNNKSLADSIKAEIIDISLSYGVYSQFTSFKANGGGDGDPTGFEYEFASGGNNDQNKYIEIISVYPNPAKDFSNIKIKTKNIKKGYISIEVLNSKGQVILKKEEEVNPNKIYDFLINFRNHHLEKGVYYISVKYKQEIVLQKIVIE